MDHVAEYELATPRVESQALAGTRPPDPALVGVGRKHLLPTGNAVSGRVAGAAWDVSADDYRLAMRNLATAVTIVTTRCGDRIHGLTASAVCCVSLSPPLLLVCLAKTSRTQHLIAEAGIFAVHLMHDGQRELAERFASRATDRDDRFRGLEVGWAVTGAPVLRDCLAYLDCRVVAVHDGGDHNIVVGAVEEVGRRERGQPLIYMQGAYVDAPGCAVSAPGGS